MKKTLFTLLFAGATTGLFAQSDISVSGIDYSPATGKYTVKFRDNSNVYLSDHNSTAFTWYLSYKDKRVSDYFYDNSGGNRNFYKTVRPWPDEVPSGREEYVTAQLGREPRQHPKDPRDDE